MLIYAGIDEAGYGPMFGPLTCGCAVLTLPDHDPAADGEPKLWAKLRKAVARELKSAKGRIVVADSKKIKLPNDGKRHPLVHLERGVWCFAFSGAGRGDSSGWPRNDLDLLRLLAAEDGPGAITTYPWYQGATFDAPCACTHEELAIAANTLRGAMKRTGVAATTLQCHLLCEGEFNRRVADLNTKAAANFGLVGRHLLRIMREHGHLHPRVMVDRQGGRTQYLDPLRLVFPDAEFRIIHESRPMSRYHIRLPHGACGSNQGGSDRGSREMTISFVESGDDLHFPIALASMLAKYVRELMMARFNRYFRGLNPELKPTAGYYGDGKRFLDDIEPLLDHHQIERDRLVRVC